MIAFALLFAAASPVDGVAEVHRLFDSLDCEKLVALADVLDHDTSLSADDRRDVAFREAYCDVVIGNVTSATRIFTALVHDDIDAKPSFDIEPRIQYLLDAARNKERDARAADAAKAKAELFSSVHIVVHEPDRIITGGMRAVFTVDVYDPKKIVRSVRLDFAKKGEPEFYALPVTRTSEGHWRGEIPGTYTKTRDDTAIRWFITVSSRDGERITGLGTRDQPEELFIPKGADIAEDLKASERLPQGSRVFYAVASGVVTVAGTFAAFLVPLALFQPSHANVASGTDYLRLWTQAIAPPFVAVSLSYFSSLPLLDPGDQRVAPIATAAVSAAYIVAGAVIAFPRPAKASFSGADARDGAIDLAAGLAGTCIVVIHAAPIVLVALDKPDVE